MRYVIVAIAILALTACAQTETQPEPQLITIGPGPEPQETGPQTYSLAEVSQHTTDDDCWLAIGGRVYDVTPWIVQHPGGQAILEGCGTDATDLYETRPMGSGTAHSDRARGLLEDYYIGELG